MRITQSMISKNLIEGLKNNREQLNESPAKNFDWKKNMQRFQMIQNPFQRLKDYPNK